MASIVIENLSERIIDVKDPSRTLLKVFQSEGIDWMQACGGKGRCTTCKLIIRMGLENFDPPTTTEDRYRDQGALSLNERLACQTKITGDVRIVVPAEYKLPHIKYSDD